MPPTAPPDAHPSPTDVDVPQPDEKSIITYVSSLYDAMPRVPDVQDGVKANVRGRGGAGRGGRGGQEAPQPLTPLPAPQELQLRWQEYRELVLLLLQWVRHHTAAFEERRFPSSFEEIEVGPSSAPAPAPPAGLGLAADTLLPTDFVVPVLEV